MHVIQHEQYSIGALADAAETKVERVRYCERIGLLPKPGRTSGNYRAYSGDHLARLSFIRRARELGFMLDQIRPLLGLADRRDDDCRAVDALASDHLASVDRKIADLKALRGELSSLEGQCKQGTIADCRIIGALSPRPGPDSASH